MNDKDKELLGQLWDRRHIPADDASGFEDLPTEEVCNDRSHNPPNMLYVPPGKRYRHVCPGCGKVSYIYGSRIRCQV